MEQWRHLRQSRRPALEARAYPKGASHSPRGRTGAPRSPSTRRRAPATLVSAPQIHSGIARTTGTRSQYARTINQSRLPDKIIDNSQPIYKFRIRFFFSLNRNCVIFGNYRVLRKYSFLFNICNVADLVL